MGDHLPLVAGVNTDLESLSDNLSLLLEEWKSAVYLGILRCPSMGDNLGAVVGIELSLEVERLTGKLSFLLDVCRSTVDLGLIGCKSMGE